MKLFNELPQNNTPVILINKEYSVFAIYDGGKFQVPSGDGYSAYHITKPELQFLGWVELMHTGSKAKKEIE